MQLSRQQDAIAAGTGGTRPHQAPERPGVEAHTHTDLTTRHTPLLPRHPARRAARAPSPSIDRRRSASPGARRSSPPRVVPFLLRPDLALEPFCGCRLLAVARSVGLEDGVPLDGIAVAVVPGVPRVAVDAGAAAGVGVRRRR